MLWLLPEIAVKPMEGVKAIKLTALSGSIQLSGDEHFAVEWGWRGEHALVAASITSRELATHRGRLAHTYRTSSAAATSTPPLLKDIAVTSDGDRLAAGRFYQGVELQIAQAQRRGHRRQAKRLHRKAARRRADALHKFSRRIVNQYETIIVGDVSSQKLVKTRMAKSVLDSRVSSRSSRLPALRRF
jgi:hypothetical protein